MCGRECGEQLCAGLGQWPAPGRNSLFNTVGDSSPGLVVPVQVLPCRMLPRTFPSSWES